MLPRSPNTTFWALSVPAKAPLEAHILYELFQAWYFVETLNPLSTRSGSCPRTWGRQPRLLESYIKKIRPIRVLFMQG